MGWVKSKGATENRNISTMRVTFTDGSLLIFVNIYQAYPPTKCYIRNHLPCCEYDKLSKLKEKDLTPTGTHFNYLSGPATHISNPYLWDNTDAIDSELKHASQNLSAK